MVVGGKKPASRRRPARPIGSAVLRSETLIHAAHARIAAPPARTDRHLGTLRRSISVRRERGKFLVEVALAARRALELCAVAGAPHKLLKLGSTILAFVFVDRHIVLYSNTKPQSFELGK
jgi:hypothetical protein